MPTPSLCESSYLQAVQTLRLPMAPSSPPCISECTMPNAVTSLHGVQTHTGTATVLPHYLSTNGLDNKEHLTAHLHALIRNINVTIIAYKHCNVLCCSACQTLASLSLHKYEALQCVVLLCMPESCLSSLSLQKVCQHRWNEIRSTVPLKLQLLNVSTQEQVACLEGRLSSRHCKARHDYIRINSSSHDGTWLLLVVASGMAEASCLGIEH